MPGGSTSISSGTRSSPISTPPWRHVVTATRSTVTTCPCPILVILPPTEWDALTALLQDGGIRVIIEPHTRFAGQPGEQSTMFFLDPAGNALEFKSFSDMGHLFSQ